MGRELKTVALSVLGLIGLLGRPMEMSAATLFQTGFEADEGYELDVTLAGQNDWVSVNAGGNGIVEDFFDGFGQQAFVGFDAPDDPEDPLYVFQPLDHTPDSDEPLVIFSVLMAIYDSTFDQFDEFRWSIFNQRAERLFTLNFDNESLLISYALDDGEGLISTGTNFALETIHELTIRMNFESNRWSASLDDQPLVSDQPMTTVEAQLDLGDISAVWVIRDPSSPGDNFMLFDEYRVATEALDAEPPSVRLLGKLADGSAAIQVSGQPDVRYTLEASDDLKAWIPLTTESASDGVFDFIDEDAISKRHRFYRARIAQP